MVERIIRSSRAWSIVIFAGMCLLATLLVLHSPERPPEQQQIQAQEPPPPPGGGTDTPDLATCEADIDGCPVYYTCGNVPFDTMPGPGGCPTGTCNCLGVPGTGPQGGRPGQNPGIRSYAASIIDNWSFNYVHYAPDYAVATPQATSSLANGSAGCASCGIGSGANDGPTLDGPSADLWTTFMLTRYFRSRDLGQISSFGPGGFCNFDTKIHAFLDPETESDIFIDLFDPTRQHPVRLTYGGQSGTFIDASMESFQDLKTYDDQDALTGDLAEMVTAELTTWTGEKFVFEIVDAGPEYIGLENYTGTTVRDGRLTRIEDRNGYGITVNYKTWTAQELTESPERQWQIDTVVTDRGESATFSYGTTQVGGLWAISQIDLPNGESITYDYSGDRLTGVTHPDGTESSFTYTSGTTITTVDIMDAAADGTHRAKSVYLTNNTNNYPGFEDDFIINSASLMVRLVANQNDEVIYWNKPSDDVVLDPFCYVYEGAGNIRVISANSTAYLEDGWYYDDSEQQVIGNEETGTMYTGGLETGAPTSIVDERGITTTYQYDSDSWMTRKTYADDTFESWCYNSFHLVTRYKDRNDNVTLYTYDSNGNMLTKAVGLTNDPSNVDDDSDPYNILTYDPCATNDVQTNEYAVYEWQYYGPSHANAYMLSASIDANGNQTDYTYDTSNRLVTITHPADESMGTRGETNYTYDSAGRVQTIIGPEDWGVEYFYDERGRVVKIEHADNSTERFFYGAASSGDENLLVKHKDRRGVVTNYAYDDSGRRTTVTHAAAVMDLNDNESAVSSSTVTIQETYAYLDGTNLPVSVTRAGELTEFTYDYRHRVVQTDVHPNTQTTLTSTSTYVDNQLFETEDPYGRSTFYAYDATDGRLIRQILGTVPSVSYADDTAVLGATRAAEDAPNSTSLITDYVYDAEGQTVRTVDPRGLEHHTEYDSRGRVTAQIQAALWADQSATSVSARTETDYDDQGNVVEIRHPRYFDSNDTNGYQNAKTTMTYTGRNLLASRTEAPGTSEAATEYFTYTLDGKPDTKTDFRGNDWQTVYHDCCGRVQATIDPLGHGTIVNHDDGGNVTHQAWVEDVTSHTNYLNPTDAKTLREVTTRYDERGRPAAQTVWLVARGTIDPNAPLIAGEGGISASDGLTTYYEYDDDLTDSAGLDSTFSTHLTGLNLGVDSDGSAKLVTMPAGERVLTVRDARGRTVRQVVLALDDSALMQATVVFDSLYSLSGYGDVLEIATTDLLGRTEMTHIDGFGRVIQVVDSASDTTGYTYNGNRDRLSIRDAEGVGTDSTYDPLGRLVAIEYTSSESTQGAYDLAGNLLSATDPKGNSRTSVFDARDRRIQSTNRLGEVTEWTYDAAGSATSVTDPEDQTTSYEYDALGRPTTTTWADHDPASAPGDLNYGITVNAYDAVGNPIRFTDELGDTVTFNYDLAWRVTSKDFRVRTQSPSGAISHSDTFDYDASSRIVTATSGAYGNQIDFTYDDAGRRESESLTVSGQTYVTTMAHDAGGRLTDLTYPDGTDVTREYTARDHLLEVDLDGSTLATFAYDDSGRETSRTYSNGLSTSITYRTGSQQPEIIDTPGVGSITYAYDDNGNTTDVTHGGALAGYDWSAQFDAADRLVLQTRDDGLSETWELSATDDIDTITSGGVAQNRTHGPAHELTAIDSDSLFHDARGNVVEDESGVQYGWDFEGRLESADVPAGAPRGVEGNHSYAYDAFGRRISKAVLGTTTVFVYAGHNVVAEYDDGAVPGQPERTFVHAEYFDDVLAMVDHTGGSPVERFYHQDWRLNVHAVTDATGAVLQRVVYDAQGNPLFLDANGSPSATQLPVDGSPYTYTGRRFDAETGLYYFRARYYSAAHVRFLARDPARYVDGLNLYAAYFVPDSTDPTGLAAADLPGVSTADEAKDYCQRIIDWKKELDERPDPPPITEEQKKECKDFIDNLLDNNEAVKRIYDQFGGRNCPRPAIVCECCKEGSGGWYLQGKITICWNNIGDDEDRIIQVLIHEGTHALQDCYSRAPRRGDCEQSLKWEIEAYKCAGQCNSFESCMRRALGSSCGAFCQNAQDAADLFDDMEDYYDNNVDNFCSFPRRPDYPPPPPPRRPVRRWPRLWICFVEGTIVHTETGFVSIEQVSEGMNVWAYDLSGGSWVLRRVNALEVNDFEGTMVTVTCGEDVIEATETHPFWVVEGDSLASRPQPPNPDAAAEAITEFGRWVSARDLRPGDRLWTRDGTMAVVDEVTFREATLRVYNISVDQLLNYSVGVAGILVHNT